MTTTTMHPLAADYLRDLEREARRLPRAERQELVEEIRAHLAEATDPIMTDAETLTVLDRLGQPRDIVKAERPDEGDRPDRRGTHEWAAIILLLFGGFVFVAGWIAGLILLWSSRAWNTRDKLIGTFVVPGGACGGGLGITLGDRDEQSDLLRHRPPALHGGNEHGRWDCADRAVRVPRARPYLHLGVPGSPRPLVVSGTARFGLGAVLCPRGRRDC